MKLISLLPIAFFCASSFAVTQNPPTLLPPHTECADPALVKIANESANDMIKSTMPTNSNSAQIATSFVASTWSTSAEADPTTGFTKLVTYPFSILNADGKTLGHGVVYLDGKCAPQGGFLEILGGPIQAIPLH